jgi:hypothetical protein
MVVPPSRALLEPVQKPDCQSEAAQAAARNSVRREPETPPPTRVSIREGGDPPVAADLSDAQKAAPAPQPATNPEFALRVRLEYERACYQHAEIQARERLQALQAWAAETAKSANHGDKASR